MGGRAREDPSRENLLPSSHMELVTGCICFRYARLRALILADCGLDTSFQLLEQDASGSVITKVMSLHIARSH